MIMFIPRVKNEELVENLSRRYDDENTSWRIIEAKNSEIVENKNIIIADDLIKYRRKKYDERCENE